MSLRHEIIRKKLLELEQTTGRLRSWMPSRSSNSNGTSYCSGPWNAALQIASEALFDTGNHILAGAFQESVDEYREIPKRLLARRVLTAETAARLAGFRNVLVHDYAEVDLQRVHAGIQRLDDFDAFVADVEQWLQTTAEESEPH